MSRDATFFLRELFHPFSNFEADGQQDADEIKTLLETTTRQEATIAALQTEVEQ